MTNELPAMSKHRDRIERVVREALAHLPEDGTFTVRLVPFLLSSSIVIRLEGPTPDLIEAHICDPRRDPDVDIATVIGRWRR